MAASPRPCSVILRVVTALAVLLAAMCLLLALAFKQANDERLCWRVVFEDGDWPAEGTCRR